MRRPSVFRWQSRWVGKLCKAAVESLNASIYDCSWASLSLTEGFSFQDFPLEPPRKKSFAMKSLRMVLSYATVAPLFTWQPYFNFYHHREQKWNRSFTRVVFSSVVINETTVCTVSSGSWFIDTSLALPWHWGPHKIRTRVPEIDDCTDPLHAGHRSQALWVWPRVNLSLYRHVETTRILWSSPDYKCLLYCYFTYRSAGTTY